MNAKNKSVESRGVDIRVLLATAGVLAVLAAIVLPLRSFQKSRLSEYFKQRAASLAKQGEYSKAYFFQRQYVLSHSEDFEGRLALVKYAELNGPAFNRRSLADLAFETIGRADPSKDVATIFELRALASEQLLSIGDFKGAELEAEHAAKASDPKTLARALRVSALASYGRLPSEGAARSADRDAALKLTLKKLLLAIERNPTDETLCSIAASLYRANPTLAEGASEGAPVLADQIMNNLVASSKSACSALTARYRYRKRYLLSGATEDLEAALKANEKDPEANFYAGVEAASKGTAEAVKESERYLSASIAAKPEDERPHLALAQVLWRQGDHVNAIEKLTEADHAVGKYSLGPAFLKIEYLLSTQAVAEAEAELPALAKRLEAFQSKLNSNAREAAARRKQLLEGQLAELKGADNQAIEKYLEIAASPVAVNDKSELANMVLRGRIAAGNLLAKVGIWDQSALQFAAAADQLEQATDPSAGDQGELNLLNEPKSSVDELFVLRTQAAEAYYRSGQSADALLQLDHLQKRSKLQKRALELRLIIELQRQLEAPDESRAWQEFQYLLEHAKEENPASLPALTAELTYWESQSLPEQETRLKVLETLEKSKSTLSASADYWRIVAEKQARAGDEVALQDALRNYEKLETDEVRKTSVLIGLLFLQGKQAEADQLLQSKTAGASEPLKKQLQRMRIELLSKTGRGDEAFKMAEEIAEQEPNCQECQLIALELAIGQQAWSSAKKIESRIPADSTRRHEFQSLQAARMIGQYQTLSQADRDQLGLIINRLRSERPRWKNSAWLAAMYSELTGDAGAALSNFQTAVRLGDRRPETLQRLALSLYRTGQYDQAQTVLNQLAAGSSASLIDALAISTALKRNKLEEAVALAQAAVTENGDDPVRRLWLYSVLREAKRNSEADAEIMETYRRFPENEAVWQVLFTHYIQAKKPEEAKQLLTKLPPSILDNPFLLHVTLGNAEEMLADSNKASKEYEAAIALKPEDSAVRLRYADLLLRLDASRAKQQFTEVLKREPGNIDARRKLAVLLASSGSDGDWDRVEQLLPSNVQDNSADIRLRAALLSRRGKSVEERKKYMDMACDMLSSLVRRGGAEVTDTDRLLLASIYEQLFLLKRESQFLEKSREQLLQLMDRGANSAANLSAYLTFLLRSIEGLDSTPDDRHMSVRAVFIADARQRLAEFRNLVKKNADSGSSMDRLLDLALECRILKLEDKRNEALKLLDDFDARWVASEKNTELRVKLEAGLGAIATILESPESAERYYKELVALSSSGRSLLAQSMVAQGKHSDVVNLFLAKPDAELSPGDAAELAGLLSARQGTDEAFNAAWPAIAEALAQHGENPELLMAVSVLYITRGKQEEAVQLLNRAVRLAPDNVVALNNLATLLGERENSRAEALELIDKAIKLSGRTPGLLDTQGTIQLELGQVAEAVRTLEEAVASINVDSRYYFHLSAAYLKNGQLEKARDSLNEARRRGIDQAVLTTSDRAMMDRLLAELNKNS